MGSAKLLLFAAFLAAAAPARAEIVVFPSGRVLSVRAIRSSGDEVVLMLRAGGEITCPKELIIRVEPDEVEYPEEIRAAQPVPDPPLGEPVVVPRRYGHLIEHSARKHGVDARVVDALIQVESAYHNRAVSSKGARGLMQLLPSTGRQYGALDLFDPRVNIDAGVRHLKTLLSRFTLPQALAAYNAGAAAVTRFRGIPPFKETQDYVARILRILSRG